MLNTMELKFKLTISRDVGIREDRGLIVWQHHLGIFYF